jgi:hypothetical protein
MSKVIELASGQITNTETITVELIEANETPAVVIIRWPSKPSVDQSKPFPHCRRHRGSHVRGCCGTAGSDQEGSSAVTHRQAQGHS